MTKNERVLFFISGFDVLDNFSAHAVEYEGVLYMTSEHAYQTAGFIEENIRKELREARSAVSAKNMATKYKERRRKDWSEIKISVMEKILTCKLQQHADVRMALLDSGDREIVENSASDYFWGCGSDNTGRNELGKTWMRLRDKYQVETIKTESAGGVIQNTKGEIALVLNGKGAFWGFPKGHLDVGEDALTAARREIQEETGLTDLTLIKQLPTYSRFKGTPTGEDDTSELKTMYIFLFSTKQIELRSQDPSNPEARWFPIDEVPKMLIHPKDKEYFNDIKLQIKA